MYKFRIHWVISILLLNSFLALQAHADSKPIKSQAVANDNDKYVYEMLKLALSYSGDKYKLTVDEVNEKTLARTITEIESGVVDIMWTATDKEKEDRMLPVRIPLYKGLFGYRIFIINKNNQAKFANIETLDDLKKITLGQGTSWADTKILEANGLHVVKTMKYPGLIYMVDGGRFDAFPRGVHEPWAEVVNYPKLDLMVEPSLMLVYKMPFYLFVNKSNTVLAKDLEDGFNQAIADGSFNKIFFANPAVQKVIENANMKNRTIFELKNPDLPPKTPVDRPELWLDVSKF